MGSVNKAILVGVVMFAHGYQKLITNYKTSEHVAEAYYMQGICYTDLGQRANAQRMFETVVKQYPGTTQALMAQQKLQILASPDARWPRSPTALPMPCKLLDKKIPEDFDALRSWASGRRHPVDGAKWKGPIRQHSLEPAVGECLA